MVSFPHVRCKGLVHPVWHKSYKRLLLVGNWYWIFILDCGIHTTETWIWHIISCDQVFGTIWRRGGGRERRVIRSVNRPAVSSSQYLTKGPLLKLNNVINMLCLEGWLIWWFHGPVFFLCSRYNCGAYYMISQAKLPVF